MINTLEQNFYFIAAALSLASIALFVYFIYLSINLSDKSKEPKLSRLALALATLYEVIVVAVAAIIIKNVIINCYDYVFLIILIVLGLSETLYAINYTRAKKIYLQQTESEVVLNSEKVR